ncbi:MAG: MG2 domain-containing protein [Blastocatellia bacterium]
MRYRLIGSLLVCLFSASIFAAKFSANVAGPRVNESATKFSLRKEGAVVALALENPRATTSPARINLELINPRGVIRATAMRETSVPSGSSVITIPLIKAGSSDYDDKELPWYRLRYEIAETDLSGKEPDPISGLISLSEITPDIFRLLVSAPQEAGKEAKYTIRARTLHPLTGNPVAGVSVEAQLAYEESDDERSLNSSGVTNSNGEALLEFKLPGPLKTEDAEIRVMARRDGFYQEAEEEISLLYPNQVLVSTDKPLYQPGQTLRVRVLGLDRDRKAWANVEGVLKIRDPEGSYIFRAGFKTSRFGVASVDWPIADNARLGEYFIEAWLGEEGPRNAPGSEAFKISRYDLPNFVVNVKPDRGYYLPGQNAEIGVRADYLFGQPVKRGRARVVRETERRWNYREQKWETEEGDKYEGALDDDGRFIARINLTEEHNDFNPDSYSRFRDLRYAAYLTDPTTGRTEQRRFDLRVTAEPIHVYLIERGRTSEELPLQFYVSTFYADGSPAQREVAISQTFSDEDDDESKAKRGEPERPLATVRTNRYGVAKIASLDVGKSERDDPRLKLTARDDQGRSGRDIHKYWDRYSPAIRVETDKTLYRAGEPIKTRLTSNSPRSNWIVDLMRGSRLLATRAVQLKDGRSEIAFPFNQEFGDELIIMAYPAFGDDYETWNSAGVAKVLYPRDRELKLDVKFDQAAYRPGDEARADLRVLTPLGRAAESALGVVIFDKAIEERARTDQEFSGRGFGFYDCFRHLLGVRESLAGVTRRDLDRVDLSKPLPEGLELVAEILLNQNSYGYYRPAFFGGDEFETDAEAVFKYEITARLKPIEAALFSHYTSKSVYPTSEAILQRQMLLAGVELDEPRDPWGTPYRPKFSVETVNDVFELISAGPDKRFDTGDDFTVFSKSWQYFQHTAAAIARTVENHYARTGGFIRDRETLKRELMSREAIDIDALNDRWGNPYRFEFGVEQSAFSIRVKSSGPNGKFEDERERGLSDDFRLSTCLIEYTVETKARINRALTAHFRRTKLIPQDAAALRDALKQSGVDFDELRDGWGNRYYATFRGASRYSDRVTQLDQARHGEKPKPKTEVTPVTQQIANVTIRSLGADGKEGTFDDVDVTDFSLIVAEESAKEAVEKSAAQTKPKIVSFSGEGGAIAGTVTDANGAIIANVTVTAKHVNSESVWTAKSNSDGAYLPRGLAPGIYEVRFEIDEPYLIASYALAAMDAGKKKAAEKVVAKLKTMVREEAGTTYWNLESNTPFYGWGLAGKIETTALAVNALKRADAAESEVARAREKTDSLVNRGLLFLPRNKDRYGVWLSTQATINVLDALIRLNEGEIAKSGASGEAEIIVNDKRVSSVAMPPGGQLSNPIIVDLSSFLSRGNNRVEIRRSGNATRASAQVVETHYEPWEQGAAERRENIRLRNSSALSLAVSYDKLEAKVGDEVTCTVVAERVGHRGYGHAFGMMLAEIGLPPGADVDRESLERAAKESGGSLNHYDVLPDRVVVYLWPRAGGLKFSFKFKPRYGVKARTAPSVLYDYYNPEARVVIAPVRVVVR